MILSTGEAIENICRDLGLPAGDSFTQDWECELPEQFRTPEWLKKYIIAYQNRQYGENEKHVLMNLILDVINDGIESGDEAFPVLWEEVVSLLRADRELHRDVIEYWALAGEPIEDCFAITPRIRKLFEERSGTGTFHGAPWE